MASIAKEEPPEVDTSRTHTQTITMTSFCHEEASDMTNEKSSTPAQQSIDKASTLVDSQPDAPQETVPVETTPNIETKDEQPPEEEYPQAWKLVLLFTGLSLCIFCLALDNTIIATAIPRITDQFKSLDDVGWYGSSYLLTTCALTLIFGKLYTFYSTKWVYMIALGVFELGSLVCGVAPNSVALIIGRAIAGLGSAGLFSGAILIISQSVPLHRRPIYSGMLGGIYGIASVAGPLMGGAFTDHLTWRWCFYINLPVGGVTALFILLFFKAPKSVKDNSGIKDQLSQLDIPGTVVFMPAVICVLLALQWGGTQYAWSNARIIALFVLFGVLIIAFGVIQWWRQEKATIPPRIIKNRNVWGSALYLFSLGAAFFVLIYYMPIWFQAVKGVSATKSGIMNLPMVLAMVICSLLIGSLTTLTGHYGPYLVASPIIMSVGCGMLTTLTADSGHPEWIGYQALAGIGAGIGMQLPMIVVQAALPFTDVPSATAILIFAQTLGGALFVSVGQNVFQNQLRGNLMHDVPSADVAEIVGAGATMLRQVVPENDLHAVLQAYSKAITQTIYVCVAASAISFLGVLPIQWISVKGKKIAATAA